MARVLQKMLCLQKMVTALHAFDQNITATCTDQPLSRACVCVCCVLRDVFCVLNMYMVLLCHCGFRMMHACVFGAK
jgi:hypothetical protein